MSATYWVLISDELVASPGFRFPAGLRFTGPEWLQALGMYPADPERFPGMTWRKVEDDDAPEDLEGRRVELICRLEDGEPVVSERKVL